MSPRPAFLSALLVLAACGSEPERPRSALLITIDTTNVDALGCYGRAEPVTPFLDRMAAESLVYDNARTVAPMTLPSHASMLTGLYPPRHTVRDNGMHPLPETADTVTERAAARGFQTAAFVAAVVLAEPFGLAQGFEHYTAPPGSRAPDGFSERPADAITDDALRWLGERDPGRPFFLWLHYFDAHAPYQPGARFVDRIRAAGKPRVPAYLGEVARVDEEIGRLVGELAQDGVLAQTLIVVVADHGEALGRHGEATHSLLAYDATIRVPLIVRYPDGHRAGERSSEFVSVVDIHPTLMEALGLGAPAAIDGMSLYRRSVPAERGVYFESFSGHLVSGWSPLSGWADARGTYLHSSVPELYDVNDRDQEHDLVDVRDGVVTHHLSRIGELAHAPALGSPAVELDLELSEDVLALGYLGSATAPDSLSVLDVAGLPNPRDHLGEWSVVFEAAQLGQRGRVKAAVRMLEGHLVERPAHLLAVETLCSFLAAQRRFDRVIEVLEPYVRDGVKRNAQVFLLGNALEREARWSEAAAVYAAASERWPEQAAFREGRARALNRSSDAE